MPAADWILWLMGAALIAAISGLVYWAWRALFKDRANGGRRCPRCWYDMAYSPGMTCGECGFTAKDEWQFEKTRRRYGQAATAIFLCVVIVLWVNYQISASSWAAFVPTKVLILALPLVDADGDVFTELRRRMLVNSISDYEFAMFLKRCARGDWRARPPGSDSEDAWIVKYGTALDGWRRPLVLRGEVTGYDRRGIDPTSAPYNDLERILMDVPPVIELSMPSQWPPHVDPRVQVRLRHWWPAGSQVRVTLVREDDPQQVITLHRSFAGSGPAFGAAVESVDPSLTELTFHVTVERRRAGLDEPWQPGSKHVMTVPVQIREDVASWPEPADDEFIRETLRDVFQGQATVWASGPVPVRFRYNPRLTLVPEMDGMAIAAAVQLRRGDDVARQLNIWWMGGLGQQTRGGIFQARGLGWEVVYENHALLSEISADDDRWHFHIEGRPELAVLAGNPERYWSGSFTVPMRLERVQSRAPMPEWWRSEQGAPEQEDD